MIADLRLAPLFTDGMVLQRNKPVVIWGSGPEGAGVTVSLAGQAAAGVVRGGEWAVRLGALEAGGPYGMEVRCENLPGQAMGASEIRIRDVWVGEVWLAAGQSNMVQPLLVTEDGIEAAAAADYPEIRFFTVPRRPFPRAQVPGWDFIGTLSEDAKWQACTPETALRFSAIGFHFSEFLRESRGVPVGIISCNWGGTPAQAWISERYLERDPLLKPLLDEYRERLAGLDEEAYEREHDRYIAAMYRLIEERGDIEGRIRELGLSGYREWVAANPLIWPDQPFGPKHPERPCGLYHTMLRTVIPYAIRGVLWYQGEYHALSPSDAGLYPNLLEGLIANWREDWQEPELPFLIVQLTGFEPAQDPDGDGWPLVREAQEDAVRRTPHTALVVTLDCGERKDIHPVDKRTVAERLALAARAIAYGETLSFEGPRFLSAECRGSSVRLTFDPSGEPPVVTDGGLAGFEVCGGDREFRPAEAHWAGAGIIEVVSRQVPRPVSVRYAWGSMPEWSVKGKNGIPALPYRSGRR